jgi:glycine dehydrogenase subunit 1
MFPTLPHTEEDLRGMLAVVGVSSLEELFADVPAELRRSEPLAIPEARAEAEVYRRLAELAARNRTDAVSFLGGGSYDHLIPAVVGAVLGRSEFYTAYTPYQAEISQGVLQAIFEFQSLICALTGLEVSNASLYDGATAVCEAASLALNSVRRSRKVLFAQTLHPHTRRVLATHFSGLDVELEEVSARDGVMDREDLRRRLAAGSPGAAAAVIVQSPNFLGYLEDLSGLAEEVHATGALLVQSADPLTLGALRSPAEWGADVAAGDAQPCGLPMYFGGPTAGYLAAKQAFLHRMPGRIAGQSVDREGRRAFVLTLQAREQHIKRERATSNICSNQALAALAVAVYLTAVGRQGLAEAARQSAAKAHYLAERLWRETRARPLCSQPFFLEFPMVLPGPAAPVLERMEAEGFFAGLPLARLAPEIAPGGEAAERTILVAATEKRTREELDRYIETMKRILK